MRHGTRAGRVRPGVVAIALLALPGLAVPPLAAQAPWERNPEAGPLGITEREAVAWLAEGTPGRFRALELAEALGPRASSELRAAVIDAAWAELRGETDSPPESEELYGYLEAVCRIRDTQAIPLLVEALVHGAGAANALADLGAEAFPAVLAAVSDRPVPCKQGLDGAPVHAGGRLARAGPGGPGAGGGPGTPLRIAGSKRREGRHATGARARGPGVARDRREDRVGPGRGRGARVALSGQWDAEQGPRPLGRVRAERCALVPVGRRGRHRPVPPSVVAEVVRGLFGILRP